jgi:hypothetical protein
MGRTTNHTTRALQMIASHVKTGIYFIMVLAMVGLTSACGNKRPVKANGAALPKPLPSIKKEVIEQRMAEFVGKGIELFERDLVLVYEGENFKQIDSFVQLDNSNEGKEKAAQREKATTEFKAILDGLKKDYAKSVFVEDINGVTMYKKLDPLLVKEMENIVDALENDIRRGRGQKQGDQREILKEVLSKKFSYQYMMPGEAPKSGGGDQQQGGGCRGRRCRSVVVAALHQGSGPDVFEKKNPEPRPPNPPGTN